MNIDYHDYVLNPKSRTREENKWSIYYSYNTNDTENLRVLLIGDSICTAYQDPVRRKLRTTVMSNHTKAHKDRLLKRSGLYYVYAVCD